MWAKVVLVAVVSATTTMVAKSAVHYKVDRTWQPAFPEGTGSFAAVDVADGRVYIGQRNTSFSEPVLVFDTAGKFLQSFGSDAVGKGVHHGAANWGVHGINVRVPDSCSSGSANQTVWVTDFLNHTVITFSATGELLRMQGDGASSDLDKFDSPADLAFHCDSAFLVDGDGGANMRVSKWSLKDGLFEKPLWVTPATRPQDRKTQEFDHPHSVCWHTTTSKIIVADRDHWRIVFMDPATGNLDALNGTDQCNLNLGPDNQSGRPFGVRTWRRGTEDFLLLAVAGNEGVETNHQMFHVLDASGFEQGLCSVLQSLKIDPLECHTPHLLGLDQNNGDVYIACNQQPNSNVLRLVRDDSNILVV